MDFFTVIVLLDKLFIVIKKHNIKLVILTIFKYTVQWHQTDRIFVEPSPPSVSRMFLSSQTELSTHNDYLAIPPSH